MTEPKERRAWHLNKMIDIPTVAMVLSFVWYAAQMDARVTASEMAITNLKNNNELVQKDVSELKGKIIEVSTKMDILLGQRIGAMK